MGLRGQVFTDGGPDSLDIKNYFSLLREEVPTFSFSTNFVLRQKIEWEGGTFYINLAIPRNYLYLILHVERIVSEISRIIRIGGNFSVREDVKSSADFVGINVGKVKIFPDRSRKNYYLSVSEFTAQIVSILGKNLGNLDWPVAGGINEEEIWTFYPTIYSFAGIYWGLKGTKRRNKRFIKDFYFWGFFLLRFKEN